VGASTHFGGKLVNQDLVSNDARISASHTMRTDLLLPELLAELAAAAFSMRDESFAACLMNEFVVLFVPQFSNP